MRQKQNTKEQIIHIFKAHEAGAKVLDLILEHGMSEQSSIDGIKNTTKIDHTAFSDMTAKECAEKQSLNSLDEGNLV